MKQYIITPAAGKRLIGKAVASHLSVGKALKTGTIVIIAGGGVCGAEGNVRLAVTGNPEQEESAQKLLENLIAEPLFVR